MSDTKLNCFICGKELELGMKVYGGSNLWRCEECANKQMQEYDNKDQKIADLETKLAESEESHHKNIIELTKIATEKDRKIEELKQKLEESEEQVKHWHDLYNERDKQFQSVRQRYHLLNKLQSNYDKRDKLHLAYMQCAELVDENEQLKQQLAEKEINITNEDFEREVEKAQQKIDQDKIEFAIEQLEKVKALALNRIKEIANDLSEEDDERLNQKHTIHGLATAITYINNLINELKEMK